MPVALSKRIEQFFAYYAIGKLPVIAVAVSGGADSMALCLALQDYLTNRDGRVVAVSIDHGLRAEAAEECLQVGKWLAAYDIKHYILALPALPERNQQAAARNARYDALADFCREHDLLCLVTAHHRDDVVETVTYRRQQGATRWGLAGIPSLTLWQDVILLRPLLRAPKQDCIDYLHRRDQPWIEDPSNQKPVYARNAVRLNLAKRDDYTSFALKTVTDAEQAIKERQSEEAQINQWLALNAKVAEHAVTLPATSFQRLDRSLALQVLKTIMRYLRQQDNVPRTQKLKRLHTQLLQHNAVKTALHHCVIERRGDTIRFYPENPLEKAHRDNQITDESEKEIRSANTVGLIPFNCYADNVNFTL